MRNVSLRVVSAGNVLATSRYGSWMEREELDLTLICGFPQRIACAHVALPSSLQAVHTLGTS